MYIYNLFSLSILVDKLYDNQIRSVVLQCYSYIRYYSFGVLDFSQAIWGRQIDNYFSFIRGLKFYNLHLPLFLMIGTLTCQWKLWQRLVRFVNWTAIAKHVYAWKFLWMFVSNLLSDFFFFYSFFCYLSYASNSLSSCRLLPVLRRNRSSQLPKIRRFSTLSTS